MNCLIKKNAQAELKLQKKEQEAKQEKPTVKPTKTSTKQGSRTEVVGKSVLKSNLTSATFIRGALGILSKC
jgi:hypothetical protein